LQWSLFIVFIIFLFRAIQLKIIGLDLRPLLFVAPRGLITILLFLSIAPGHNISFVSKSLIIQVIIITTFIMMFGLITSSKNEKNTNNADPTHLSN
jgi:potassium/hydrogen antiporter